MGEVFDAGQVEVDVLGVDAFRAELLVEEVARERMAKRMADDAEGFHYFFERVMMIYVRVEGYLPLRGFSFLFCQGVPLSYFLAK